MPQRFLAEMPPSAYDRSTQKAAVTAGDRGFGCGSKSRHRGPYPKAWELE